MTDRQRKILRILADPCNTITPMAPSDRGAIQAALEEIREIGAALDESVKLQSHYAVLLNDYDGGQRRGFASGREWIQRLRECAGRSET